ncbi:MAG: enoyl-CoA hydratase/isomerase family protein, partial [Sphingomonadales bacterium]
MIQVDRDGAIATITISRPGTRNALPIAGWLALADAARAIGESDARCVLLQSDVPLVFSAGADIGEFAAFTT